MSAAAGGAGRGDDFRLRFEFLEGLLEDPGSFDRLKKITEDTMKRLERLSRGDGTEQRERAGKALAAYQQSIGLLEHLVEIGTQAAGETE